MEGDQRKSSKPSRVVQVLAVLVIVLIIVGVGLLRPFNKAPVTDLKVYFPGASLIALALLVGGITLGLEYRRDPTQFQKTRAALLTDYPSLPLPSSGSVQLELDPTYIKQLKLQKWLIVVIPLLQLALLANLGMQYLSPHSLGVRTLPREVKLFDIAIGIGFLVYFSVIPSSMKTVSRATRRRIGADKGSLLYDAGDGVIQRFDWSLVMSDKRSTLLLGKKLVRLAGPRAVAFPAEPLRGYVLARIPEQNKVPNFQLFMLSIRRGNRANLLLLILFVGTLSLQLLRIYDPSLWQTVRIYLHLRHPN